MEKLEYEVFAPSSGIQPYKLAGFTVKDHASLFISTLLKDGWVDLYIKKVGE